MYVRFAREVQKYDDAFSKSSSIHVLFISTRFQNDCNLKERLKAALSSEHRRKVVLHLSACVQKATLFKYVKY